MSTGRGCGVGPWGLALAGQPRNQSSCRRLYPAETGRVDRHVCPGGGNVETLLDDPGFGVLAQPHQAFVKPMQTPDVLWMLTGSWQGAVEAEIGAVDRFRFLHAALLKQERSKRMACRLHPRPGFVIGQIVIELD